MSDLLILDGGMGRLLQSMGAPFRQPEWSAAALIDAPDFVSQAHRAFIDAGADVITTNSYALIPFHIGQERFDNGGRALIALAAKLARKAANDATSPVKVAGCIPPVFGSYRPDYFSAYKAAALYGPLIEEQESDCDLWLVETMSSLEEAAAVMKALQRSNKPKWMSFTLTDREGDTAIPPQLRAGESIEDVATFIKNHDLEGVLFNCSQPEEMQPALQILQDCDVTIRRGAYANAFTPISKTQQANDGLKEIRSEITPQTYQEFAAQWISAGASIIGGCCGVGPNHINALSKLKLAA